MRCRKRCISRSGVRRGGSGVSLRGSRSTRAAFPRARWQRTGKAGRKTGTKITFKPDTSIMDATKFNFDTLAQRLRELAFLNKGLKITLTDEREDPPKAHEFFIAAASPSSSSI